MIVPSGKRRQQIAQGQQPYESFLDGIDFDKIAQLKDPKPFKTPGPEQDPGGDVATALQQGNAPGMSGRFNEPGGRAPGDRMPKMPADRGMGGPEEHEMGGMGGPEEHEMGGMGNETGNRWLSPDGSVSEEQQSQDVVLLDEKRKLRQAAGPGFAVNLKRNKEMFELLLIPPQGYSVPQPDDFVTALMKSVQGVPEDVGDPDPNTGAMKVVYKSQMVGLPRVEKANAKGRR